MNLDLCTVDGFVAFGDGAPDDFGVYNMVYNTATNNDSTGYKWPVYEQIAMKPPADQWDWLGNQATLDNYPQSEIFIAPTLDNSKFVESDVTMNSQTCAPTVIGYDSNNDLQFMQWRQPFASAYFG